MQLELAAFDLHVDLERRILPTHYCGTFCFPAGFSKKDCIWIMQSAIRAVAADKHAHAAKLLEEEPEL